VVEGFAVVVAVVGVWRLGCCWEGGWLWEGVVVVVGCDWVGWDCAGCVLVRVWEVAAAEEEGTPFVCGAAMPAVDMVMDVGFG
jgi:hypothetical protein